MELVIRVCGNRILCKEPTASVITNNNMSKPFPLYRGTRQGDHSFSFALAQEAVAACIRLRSDILPITHQGIPHNFLECADDVVLFI